MNSRASSRSDGEVLSSDSEKATKSLSARNNTNIDRHTRPSDSAPRSPAPASYRPRSDSRSPYRASRDEKRRRENDHLREPPRHDPRKFSVRYEDDSYAGGRRSKRSYEDLDPGHNRRTVLSYDDDRDCRPSKRSRTHSRSRSRSPYRHTGSGSKHGVTERRDQSDADYNRGMRDGHPRLERDGDENRAKKAVSSQKFASDLSAGIKDSAKPPYDQSSQRSEAREQASADNDQKIVSTTADHDFAIPQVKDEAALIEERRKRREAIKNKYRGQVTSLIVQALQLGVDGASAATSASGTPEPTRRSASPVPSIPGTPKDISEPQSPAELSLAKDEDIANRETGSSGEDADEPSAADYDPTVDMQEERARHDKRMIKEQEASNVVSDQVKAENLAAVQAAREPSPPKKAKDTFDMFAEEDDDDMFAEAPTQPSRPLDSEPKVAHTLDVTMMDNWDDPEGYYNTILGELIQNRYHVTQNLGRGMFSSVVRATDSTTNTAVAIKIVRNNDTMRRAGMKEIDILKDIATNDPEDKKHVIRLLRSFDHKGHLCMVFENLSLNLREVLKKFGRDVGINIKAIRAYAQQLFLGLALLKKCQYLHADLKPDNILVNEGRNLLKICDLGSASSITENLTAPYLVSRFYRAPEIILGIPYDYGIDVWSIGCTLFELYTGKILFTGRNNNAMLRAIMECRGKFPHKQLRRGTLTYQYFDDLLNFQSIEEDKLTGRVVTKMIDIKARPVRDLKSRLVPKGKKLDDQEKKEVDLFLDLLDKCLDLRVEKRIMPNEALKHPFILRAKA